MTRDIMNNKLNFSFFHAIPSLETTPGITCKYNPCRGGCCWGLQELVGKKSQINTDIHRDICCQLIQDHVLTQPESHAEGRRVSQRGGVWMSLQDGKWASAEWGVLVTWRWGQQGQMDTHSHDRGTGTGQELCSCQGKEGKGNCGFAIRGTD